MIYSFNVWHVKLVDELYNGKYSLAQKSKSKSDTSFSLFGKKKSADDADNSNTDNTLNDENNEAEDKNRKGSLSFGLFGKKW